MEGRDSPVVPVPQWGGDDVVGDHLGLADVAGVG